MTDDLLKKPVHVALLKETHIRKLQATGQLQEGTPLSVQTPKKQPLPKAPRTNKRGRVMPKYKSPLDRMKGKNKVSITKQANLRVQLKVVYDQLPPLPEDQIPPCGECKTAACCKAFLVYITKEEYESGVYGDTAIRLPPEVHEQVFGSKFLAPVVVQMPMFPANAKGDNEYILEGALGQPCPFLREDNGCGIYEHRPYTCRSYTCVGDERITQEMRDGTAPIFDLSKYDKND